MTEYVYAAAGAWLDCLLFKVNVSSLAWLELGLVTGKLWQSGIAKFLFSGSVSITVTQSVSSVTTSPAAANLLAATD